ncbi:DUF1656 domain-containing protein [Xanthobacter versatilis]|uniref:DUF1656 domain-containing protein n=1 Tax=Xanthobacter autotrophicus (strain ATCC BAA-1158 / Py2) TaxID=78245 RepID=UPI00372BED1D
MPAEIDIFGVYVPSFLLLALAAMAVTRLLSRLFSQVGLSRLIWHRALFDLAVFVLVTGAGYVLLQRIT